MTILDTITQQKHKEVAAAKTITSIQQLEQYPYFERSTISLAKRLATATTPGIIAEFKRKSPSKGSINDTATPEEVGMGYEKAGAVAMSVLTDTNFFGGTATDLQAARAMVQFPLLRKDFMIDEYQLYEAKAWGADIILLIAACLEPIALKRLAKTAKELGLDVLLEVHNEQELLANLIDEVDMIGVNNRNLKDFTLSLDYSYQLAELIPNRFIKISESGISETNTVKELFNVGYKGFLMGENFMKTTNPGKACAEFIEKL